MTRRTAFSGNLIDLVVDDGMEIVVHGPAVAIVAVDLHERVVFVRQQRPAVGGQVLELPAGGVSDDESPLAAARRELREETGLHGGEWFEAASFFTTPGFCDERIHLFVATGLEDGDPDPEESEDLELVRVPVGELGELVDEIEDGKTLAGLLLYFHLRLRP
jgi:ADP-ribose pyrophosphatase